MGQSLCVTIEPANPDDPKCRGPLVDSIINFNEDLPEDELDSAFENAKLADLCIVLGSSLRVYPAADIPGDMIKRGAKVVIVNLLRLRTYQGT